MGVRSSPWPLARVMRNGPVPAGLRRRTIPISGWANSFSRSGRGCASSIWITCGVISTIESIAVSQGFNGLRDPGAIWRFRIVTTSCAVSGFPSDQCISRRRKI